MKKRRLSYYLFLASALLLALPGQIMGMNIVKETEDDSKPVITEMSALEIASYVNAQDEENEDLLDAVTASQGDDGAAVSDFETMRLILLTQDLQKSYGASRIVKYDDMDMYLLQYETKSAAAEAYSLITEDLGSASCYADTIISEEAAAPLPSDYYWDYPSYDDEDRLISSWGTAFMGMDVLRDQVITDHPVTVAVLDSGLDVSNPFFDHYTISNRCYDFDQGKRGKKYMTDGDKDGHGTHVAGTILDALPSNTIMLPLRIVYGQTPVSEFASAISYAVDEGAQIINCSFYVGTFDDYGKGPLDSVLQKAKSNNVIVVASAGNDSQNSLIYPGSSTLTVCVSSIDCFDGYISYFSNYDSRVDFTAPGEGITAAKDGSRDGSLKSMDGTSMSTPEVSAAFAYLKMAYPNDTWKKSYNRLKSMCQDLGDEGKDIYYGWGMPVMSGLLDQMHVHDFQASTTSKGQHILHCYNPSFCERHRCGYETKVLSLSNLLSF